MGLYWEVYFRKTKGIIEILVKKNKKKKKKKDTEPSGIEKDWVDEMRREWEVANKSAKVTYLVTEAPR